MIAGAEPMTSDEEAALGELLFEVSGPHTLEEIAEYTGMTLRSVHRIEKRALVKMRGVVTEGWDSRLREPPRLTRRCGDVFPGDGAAPKRETES